MLVHLNLACPINSLAHYAKGTPSLALRLLVSTWFQVYFAPLNGVLFTFPSRYSFTIGRQVVLSLGRWSSQIPPGFHVPQGTQVLTRLYSAFVYGGITLYAAASQLLPLTLQIPLL